MLSRKSVWGVALLVLSVPALITAQDAPATTAMQCPMMQMSGAMMQQGMMQQGTMPPGMMQPGMMQRNMPGMQMPQAMGYDKANEVTVSGTVTEVVAEQNTMMSGGQTQGQRPRQGMMGMGGGLHLMFKTADETVEVALGPKSWLDDHHYTFAVGDSLTIIGSRTSTHDMATMTNKVMIVARQITKGGETMTLRDENGRPEWAGPSQSR